MGGKMNSGMPKSANPKLYLGIHARLVFLKKEDEQAVLNLMRRFSSATRFAYRRLLEGKTREELKNGKAAPSAPSSASTPATPTGEGPGRPGLCPGTGSRPPKSGLRREKAL